jgi:hypothetical protein
MGKASAAKAARRALLEEQAADTRQFWHGGRTGRSPGEVLVPGNLIPDYAEFLNLIPTDHKKELGINWVYVTTDRDLAFDYAVRFADRFGSASLYEVAPAGILHPDPDYPNVEGLSHRVRRATVVTVEQTLDQSAPYANTGAGQRYMTWDDGTPMYDSNLFPLPNLLQRELGVTALDLRVLRPGTPHPAIIDLANEIATKRNPRLTQADVDALDTERRRLTSKIGNTLAGA